MLISSPHNLNLCSDSQDTRFLWNVFEAVQKTRSTCFIGFKNTRLRLVFLNPIKHCCSCFKQYVKYLGVIIDQHLSWKHHINYIALKISRNIGIISRLRHFVPLKTLLSIYNSLISPYISYGLIAWGQASKSHLEKLVILQKRAVHLINFLPFRTHAIPYFAQSNILPITMLYFKFSSILMFYITTNSAPQNICNLFTLTQDIHQYNARSASSGNYYINHSRLNHHKNSFSIVGAKIWNSIPKSYRKLPKHIFKKKIQALLIVTLETLDSYADISTLISEIKKAS